MQLFCKPKIITKPNFIKHIKQRTAILLHCYPSFQEFTYLSLHSVLKNVLKYQVTFLRDFSFTTSLLMFSYLPGAYFPHYLVCLFSFLIVSIELQKLLILMKFNLSLFTLVACVLMLYLRNCCLMSSMMIYTLFSSKGFTFLSFIFKFLIFLKWIFACVK